MKRVSVFIYLAAVLAALASPGGTGFAKELRGMYTDFEVAREQPRLRMRVNEIYAMAYRPNLLLEEQRALAGMTIDTPLTGDPVLGYYADPRSETVTMPAVALLFFEDLATAFSWLSRNGYRLETIEEYLTMLKYKDATAFGGRYPTPLKALGIPVDALEDAKVKDLSLRIRNTGWAFILGHEIGHVRFRHPLYSEVSPAVSQGNEMQADHFALELMRRTGDIPFGALLFFQTAIYYFGNRADFAADRDWAQYLQNSARHPVTSDRLRALAQAMNLLAPDFAQGKPNPAAEAASYRFIAQGFLEFSNFLKDPTLQRVMRAKAENSSPATLAPRRTRETLQDFR